MAAPVTYGLCLEHPNSDGYYRCVREFADEVHDKAGETVGPLVSEFVDYVRAHGLEEVRTSDEYMLELLSFGILWSTYGGYALAVRHAPFITLARMAEWRKRHQRVKPAIDLARGILTTLYLLPDRGKKKPPALPTMREVDRLSLWLEATGEFREQALRFVRWRAYWETLPSDRRVEAGVAVMAFTNWFTTRSLEVLGEYTANVEPFLRSSGNRYRWREDRVSCMRTRTEYHLNLVGAEIMNRAFEAEFEKTETKAVLVPGCMRGRVEGECKAKKVLEGLRCEGCLPGCRVNQLRAMGKKQQFEVYIIPHASDLSLWSPRPGRPSRGVVASACVTTLVEGGWELKRYDVPAQCVLLDYSGCEKHWQTEGIPTAINVRELRRILDGREQRTQDRIS